ncbi:hypothetical protein Bca4012_069933 [Brassica carinata]|uniref:Glycine-rich protein n=1 Tax=Brassica carinata TaxID=52824 RepID=A0A8X7QCC8_BRACI|nr:hypothetical protein Bca52824_062147 [Brassica carinata]
MCLKRTSLVLYIIIHLQHNFSSVSSRSSSVDTYHESLPLRAIKPDIVGFEGKTQELAVVIKKEVVAYGGGWGGGGRSTGRGSVGPLMPIPIGGGGGTGGTGGFRRSSSNRNIRGEVCAVCWLSLSVLAGLLLV